MRLEHHHVFFEGPPGRSPSETMGELCAWLGANRITPVGFDHLVLPSGRTEVQVTFGNRRDARLFERAFCLANQP